MSDEDISPYWRIAPQLGIVEVVLLILGLDPQGEYNWVENMDMDRRPQSYNAVRAAIFSALETKQIDGLIHREIETNHNGFAVNDSPTVDIFQSYVEIDSLTKWLRSKGMTDNYFFPADDELAAYMNPDHPRYSAKLAATVEAWEAFDENDPSPGTAKQKLQKWLRLNAARFGFVDDEGKTRENVIEEIAKIANWATKGGAPKLQAEESAPDN